MSHNLKQIRENIDKDGNVNYTETWLCKGSYPDYLIRGLYGAGYLLSIDKRIYDKGAGGVWYEVDYTFGPPPDGRDDNESDNPLNQPVKIQMGSRMITIAVEKDQEGKPILNSMRDRFQDVIQCEVANTLISVSKNRMNDATGLFTYAGCTNSDSFLGCPRDTLRFIEPQQSSEWHKDIGTYWSVSITLEYNPRRWNPTEYLDCGFRYKNDKGKIVKVDGATPVLLNQDGTRIITHDQETGEATGAEAHFLKFNHFERAPFQRILGSF